MIHQKVILMTLSRLLDYPDESLMTNRSEIVSFIEEQIDSAEIQKEILSRIQPLLTLPLKDMQELYVETFDHMEQTNLYLTAHELGDSRKRGLALIQLQNLIQDSGYQCAGKELMDYIPLLLEFLAVTPEEEVFINLSRRISYAINRIVTNLPKNNIYKRAAELLMIFVFKAPNKQEMYKLELLREQADLEELPYPLMYR